MSCRKCKKGSVRYNFVKSVVAKEARNANLVYCENCYGRGSYGGPKDKRVFCVLRLFADKENAIVFLDTGSSPFVNRSVLFDDNRNVLFNDFSKRLDKAIEPMQPHVIKIVGVFVWPSQTPKLNSASSSGWHPRVSVRR